MRWLETMTAKELRDAYEENFREEVEDAVISIIENDPWSYAHHRDRDRIADRFDEPVFFDIFERHNIYMSREGLIDIIQAMEDDIDETLVELAGMEDYRRNPERYYGYPWR